MITATILFAFYNLVYAVISALASILPLPTDLSSFNTAMKAAGDGIAVMSTFVPLGTLSAVIALLLSIEGAIFAFKAGYFGIKKIPTIS